jgi:hypothetical protein
MMKKLIKGTVLTLSLVIIVVSACFAPAFGSVTYYQHANRSGEVIIDIAGHQPPIMVSVVHLDGGDHGVADFLEVSTYQYIPPLGRSVWATVAVVTDSPSMATFFKDFIFKGLPGTPITILLVNHCQLQVSKVCKTVFAYWTESIVTPTVTLPPGCLLFRGYGFAQTDHKVENLPNGVTITFDTVGYAAHATFVCPSWKYCGPVGDETTTMYIAEDTWISHA